MRKVLFACLFLLAFDCNAQISVDTAKNLVTVKEKTATGVKTMTIYRSLVPGAGLRNQVIYQPDASEFGEEPPTLALNFDKELVHIKAMLDAAVKKKNFNFSKFAINLVPYTDITARLVVIFSGSKEWNDYLKTAGNLKHTTTLDDGTQVTEIAYDAKVAASVLDKSNFMNELNATFAGYGYKVISGGFPEEHQPVVAAEKLVALGKNSNLLIPMPNNFFLLAKIAR